MTALCRMGDNHGIAYIRLGSERLGCLIIKVAGRSVRLIAPGSLVLRSERLQLNCRTWRLGPLGTVVVRGKGW